MTKNVVSVSSMEDWNAAYSQKLEAELSWHQDDPSVALGLMKKAGLDTTSSVIDIYAGTSRLMDKLIYIGLSDLLRLDLSKKRNLCSLFPAQGAWKVRQMNRGEYHQIGAGTDI